MDKEIDLRLLRDRPFNPNLYPKVYLPSTISNLLSFVFIGPFIHGSLIFASKQPYNYELLAILIFAFILFYFMFGYSLVLHHDRVEVNVFPFKTVIKINEITEFHLKIGGKYLGVLSKTKTNQLLIF